MLLMFAWSWAPVQGAVSTWVGTGTTNNFSDAANWGGTVPPNGNDIVFSAAAFPTRGAPVNDMSGLVVNAINVYAAYTISGNAITCNAINDNNATTATISMPLITNGSAVMTITVASADGILMLSGGMSGAGPVTYGGPGTAIESAAGSSSLTGATSLTLGSLHVWDAIAGSAITVSVGTLVLANDCTVGDVTVASGVNSALSCNETTAVKTMHATCGALSVGGGSFFQVVTKGAASSLYTNVSASSVTLTGATLTVDTTAYFPLVGAVLTIIHNTGSTTGTFAGLVEGATVTSATNPGSTFVISYVGGSGHDVTLTTSATATATGTATATAGTGSGSASATTATGTTTGGGGIGSSSSSGKSCGLGGGMAALLGLGILLARRKA